MGRKIGKYLESILKQETMINLKQYPDHLAGTEEQQDRFQCSLSASSRAEPGPLKQLSGVCLMTLARNGRMVRVTYR